MAAASYPPMGPPMPSPGGIGGAGQLPAQPCLCPWLVGMGVSGGLSHGVCDSRGCALHRHWDFSWCKRQVMGLHRFSFHQPGDRALLGGTFFLPLHRFWLPKKTGSIQGVPKIAEKQAVSNPSPSHPGEVFPYIRALPRPGGLHRCSKPFPAPQHPGRARRQRLHPAAPERLVGAQPGEGISHQLGDGMGWDRVGWDGAASMGLWLFL